MIKTINHIFWGFMICLSSSLHADSALGFKKDLVSQVHWTPYLLGLGFLFVALIVLAKKSKGFIKTNAQCQLIESIFIHYKTKVHVIEYHGQRFLIADNQQALAIHPLHKEEVQPSL
ncbi:MAG: hypothetical protein P4L65_10450 [Legionella sp.]|nr:hypothetical protein [Legionella sp.]